MKFQLRLEMNLSLTILSSFYLRNISNAQLKDKHNLLDLNIITSDNLSSLQTMSFSFKIQRDVIIAKHFIDKQRTLKWQNYFESTIPIDPPCYYQGHFFIQKINSRGKSQNRAIVFSNKVIIDIL